MSNKSIRFCLGIVSLLALSACGGKPTSSLSSTSVSLDSSVSSSTPSHTFAVQTASFFAATPIGNDYKSEEKGKVEYGYYEDEPQIVYMELGEALEIVHRGEIELSVSGAITTYECPTGVIYHVDSSEDTIVVEKFDMGGLFALEYGACLGLIDSEKAARIVDDSKSVYHPCESDLLLDLGAYDLDIVDNNGTPYIPFSVVNNLTFVESWYAPVAFNGTAFYFIDFTNGAMSYRYQNNSYTREYYDGAFSKQYRSPAFIDHNYHAFLFSIDHFYGFRDERFVPFENYLRMNYPALLEDLRSNNYLKYEQAVEMILNVVIGDGHTNAGDATSAFGGGQYETTGLVSERSAKLKSDRAACQNARQNAGAQPNVVRYNGNTAILSFDSFRHAESDLTPESVKTLKVNNKDTYALLLTAMWEIEERGDIENVIFDITCNGGGDTNALIPMLGLMNREFKMSQFDALSNSYTNLDYVIDTNLDGVFDGKDGYQGQYNFFILTSNYSFSCANMFPYVAKTNGIAKIIGAQSGGGACAVRYAVTPDGRPYRISGLSRTGELANPAVHDDAGVPVDHQIDLEHFYDDSYLNQFVNSI